MQLEGMVTMENTEFAIWGMGGAVATALILQLLKAVWTKDGEPVIKDRWAVVASIAVGLILSAVAYLAGIYPAVATALHVIGAGLLAGLAACGLYSGAKRRD